MHRIIVVVVIVICCLQSTARATCVEIEDGCSVCCSGPDRCSTSCPKKIRDWRPGRSYRLEGAVGGVVAYDDGVAHHGASGSVGYHRFYKVEHQRIIGNEIGADVAAEYLWNDRETRVWIAPVLRVSRASRVRTPSIVGMLLPGVGWRRRIAEPDQIMFRWSVFPIDVRLLRRVAISVEPIAIHAGIGDGFDGWWSSSIHVRVGTP